MADRENDPSSANVPAPEAPATDAAFDTTPAGASATEATDAAPTAAEPKPLSKAQKKAQKQKREREAKRAARPKVIATPAEKIVSVNRTGLLGRIRTDNSHRKGGQVEILDSNGDPGWYYPGALADVDQNEKDAFEDEEKKPRCKPYYLGGGGGDDDDASESDDDDEALEPPPVAKDATVRELQQSAIMDLLRHVEGSAGFRERRERARYFGTLLADTSDEKADERAALIASTGAILQNAWSTYENHQKKYPRLYPEAEAMATPKDIDVNIDHVELPDYVKENLKSVIKDCVAEDVDLSFIKDIPVRRLRSWHFTEALARARDESREVKESERLAGKEAPALPTSSMPGQHVAYQDSVDADFLRDMMVSDADAFVRDGTLVPAVGGGGGVLRGGFFRGVGVGAVFRFVGMPTPAFPTRYDKYAVLADDPVEATSSGLRIDMRFCFRSSEWAELEPRCILASKIALEVLPDSASDSERAQAVYGAYYEVVERHEHETV